MKPGELERLGCTLLPNGVQLNGWRFESESGPILSTRELEALQESLPVAVPSLPDAIFGHNRLTLTHEATRRAFHFDANGAIRRWVHESAHKGSGGLRVATASYGSWQEAADKMGVATDYDWTFSTDYCGTTSPPGASPVAGSRSVSSGRDEGVGRRDAVSHCEFVVPNVTTRTPAVRLSRESVLCRQAP